MFLGDSPFLDDLAFLPGCQLHFKHTQPVAANLTIKHSGADTPRQYL